MSWSLSHVAIAVPDLDIAVERLQAVYGLSATSRHVNTAQGVRMAYVDIPGGGRLELVEPLAPESAVGRFIGKNPSGGVHHISFATPDLDATVRQLGTAGVAVLGDGMARNVHGDRIAFIHPRDFLGVLVEVEEAPAADGP